MIDLHTHSIFSDGEFIPSELVRRAQVAGYSAIAITDHVDHSNIDMTISGLVKITKILNKYWNILVLPGVEITHVPLPEFSRLASYARKKGVKIVVAHGESPVEPVLAGTNHAAICARVDILAHPGFINENDARMAAEKGVYLELTARQEHSQGNKHVFGMASMTGAKLVVNTDAHSANDLLSLEKRDRVLKELTRSDDIIKEIINNSKTIVEQKKHL